MIASHISDTYDMMLLPTSKSLVGCCWVFIVKVGLDEQIDQLKAHLVAKSNTQIFGLDYGYTFSPLLKLH